MSEREDAGAPLPGPPPPTPDLAAVSASIDPAPVPAGASAPTPRVEPAADAPGAGISPGVATPPPGVMRPSVDVADVPAASRLPGAPAAEYGRLPTAPVATTLQGPVENEPAEWTPAEPRAPRPFVGAWALGLAIVALAASFAVGWMLPLGLIAVVVAIIALRRPVESRAVAVWAIVLAALSVLYSAGWLLWAAWVSGLLD